MKCIRYHNSQPVNTTKLPYFVYFSLSWIEKLSWLILLSFKKDLMLAIVDESLKQAKKNLIQFISY